MKKIWDQFVAWILNKLVPWLKKNWMIINYLVIFLAYNNVYGKAGVGFAEVLLGLWLFVCAAYGLYTIFSKTPPTPPVV